LPISGTAACQLSIRHQRLPGLPNAPLARPRRGFFPNPRRDSPTVAGPHYTPTGPTKKWARAHSSVRPASERNLSIFPLHGKCKIRVSAASRLRSSLVEATLCRHLAFCGDAILGRGRGRCPRLALRKRRRRGTFGSSSSGVAASSLGGRGGACPDPNRE